MKKTNMQSLAGWRRLQEDDTTYIVKTCSNQNLFRIVVSDLVHIWVKESTEKEILEIVQELNPLIECSEKAIVYRIWSLVDTFLEEEHRNISSSLQVLLDNENVLQLKFRTLIDGLALKLHFKLPRENSEMFYKEVTLPLFLMAEDLLTRQEYLCSLLEKKDVEISQYKMEGACLQRSSVETQPFVKQDFLAKLHLSKTITNHSIDLGKIIYAANLLSKSDQGSPKMKNDLADEHPLNGQQPDQGQHNAQSVTSTEEEKNEIGLDVKVEEEKNTVNSIMQTVQQDISFPKVVKKKKPKLNL